MITRLAMLLLAAVGLFVWFRRLFAQAGPAQRPASPEMQSDGSMVRDRVCNTFLPRSRALVLHDGSGEHFFCSESCRSTFLARRSA